jgi:hypothetical protein
MNRSGGSSMPSERVRTLTRTTRSPPNHPVVILSPGSAGPPRPPVTGGVGRVPDGRVARPAPVPAEMTSL